LFNFIMVTGIFSLTFGLVSCGGGGDVSGSSSNTPTIAYMTAVVSGVPGIIAAPTAQPLTIYGTNFVSGTTVTVTNNSTGYPVTSPVIVSSSEITTNVTIPAGPNDSYVTVTLQPPGGNSVSGILGVAHAYKTLANDIQPIFDSNCVSCHDNAGVFDLSTSSLSATSLIQTQSSGCPQYLRVTAGDPRRTSNVLVDVIKSKAAGLPAALSCNNSTTRQMPQGVAPALGAADIEAIVDWIALGAY
jgi:hypothetical protein